MTIPLVLHYFITCASNKNDLSLAEIGVYTEVLVSGTLYVLMHVFASFVAFYGVGLTGDKAIKP